MNQGSHIAVKLDGVSRNFGDVVAVDRVSIDIQEGEFFSLLGPSGCGKTTTLRMMAGFEFPDQGAVYIRGEDVTWAEPNKRPVNMVFQAYELFPHMTVYENVAYGLKLKKLPKTEIKERVTSMLEIVGVGGLERRAADQLSGGQQQRVALARALVNRPAVLLLDEPLSALDVKLRKRMQFELKSIQEELGTTFVYVTHDQEEALLMSDRIAIMHQGRLLQVGSPREVYEQPADPFVADFVGTLNDFSIRVDTLDGQFAVMNLDGNHRARVRVTNVPRMGVDLRSALRPERLRVSLDNNGSEDSILPGQVSEVVYVGPITQYLVETPIGTLTAHHVSDRQSLRIGKGATVVVSWSDEAAFALPEGDEPDSVE